MMKYSKYVGLGIHKAHISVGVANAGKVEALY